MELAGVNLAGGIAADRLEHLGKTVLGAVALAGHHGTAADEDGGDIQTAGGKQHAGNDLVTVGNEYDRVHRMSGEHDLDGIRDEFAGRQGVLHAGVVHRQTVAHADGLELKRHTARVADTRLDSLADLAQVHMTGYVLTVRVDHADKGALHFGIRDGESLQQRAVRRAGRTFFEHIASHDANYLFR